MDLTNPKTPVFIRPIAKAKRKSKQRISSEDVHQQPGGSGSCLDKRKHQQQVDLAKKSQPPRKSAQTKSKIASAKPEPEPSTSHNQRRDPKENQSASGTGRRRTRNSSSSCSLESNVTERPPAIKSLSKYKIPKKSSNSTSKNDATTDQEKHRKRVAQPGSSTDSVTETKRPNRGKNFGAAHASTSTISSMANEKTTKVLKPEYVLTTYACNPKPKNLKNKSKNSDPTNKAPDQSSSSNAIKKQAIKGPTSFTKNNSQLSSKPERTMPLIPKSTTMISEAPYNGGSCIAETNSFAQSNLNLDSQKEEAMDFDNPFPEIMQMIAETSYSFPDYDDAMDVDIMPMLRKQLVIIPDTNVWIDHKSLLEQLLNTEYPLTSYPTIVIPWMVLQEIDHNIHRRSNTLNNSGQAFRSAAKFIHSLLSAKHPRVKGQKATEAIIGMEFSELMADDSILNCAIQYSKQPQFITIFVTNDINLLNKALVHEIIAHKGDTTLVKTLQELCSGNEIPPNVKPFSYDSVDQGISSVSSSSMSFSTPTSVKTVQHSFNVNEVSNVCEMEIDDPMDGISTNSSEIITSDVHDQPTTFETVVISVKQALTNIIVPKMVAEYGEEGWKFAIKIKPPFTFESALKCLQSHWIAVFSFVFPNKTKQILDELLDVFHTKPVNNSESNILSWRLTICQMTLLLLSSSNNLVNRERVSNCCKLLKKFLNNNTQPAQEDDVIYPK